MSDTSQGPGWWQASDDKWYAPEFYPPDWPKPTEVVAATDVSVTDYSITVAPEVHEASAEVVPADTADAESPTGGGPAEDLGEFGSTAEELSYGGGGAVAGAGSDHGFATDHVADSSADLAPDVDETAAKLAGLGLGASPAIKDASPSKSAGESLFEKVDNASAGSASVSDVADVSPHDVTPSGWSTPSVPSPSSMSLDPWSDELPPATTEMPSPTSPGVLGDEPTLARGIPQVDVPEPTTMSPVVTPTPASWDVPDAPPISAHPPSGPGFSLDPPASTEPAAALGKPAVVPASIALLGALAIIVGSFLDWGKAAGTLASGSVNGLTGSNGWGTLFCGLAVAIGAALLLARRHREPATGLIALGAVIAIGLAIFSWLDIGSTSDDLPGILRDAGASATVADGAKLDIDLGLWVVIGGAALALIGGLLALASRPKASATKP